MTVYIISTTKSLTGSLVEGHPVATIGESVQEYSRRSGQCQYRIGDGDLKDGKISRAKKWAKYLCLPEAECIRHRVKGSWGDYTPATFAIPPDELRY